MQRVSQPKRVTTRCPALVSRYLDKPSPVPPFSMSGLLFTVFQWTRTVNPYYKHESTRKLAYKSMGMIYCLPGMSVDAPALHAAHPWRTWMCQRQIEMSYSLPSRNVRFG